MGWIKSEKVQFWGVGLKSTFKKKIRTEFGSGVCGVKKKFLNVLILDIHTLFIALFFHSKPSVHYFESIYGYDIKTNCKC